MPEFQKNLWAPWRMEYIESLPSGTGECFLCRDRDHADDDEANYVLWRGPHTLVLLNQFPYSNGHVLVAPRQHVPTLEDLPEDALLEMMCRIRDAKRVLEKAVAAQGFNIGFNVGACAGAGLPGHLHAHIVPRWSGDVNYMAVLGNTRVLPQALAKTAAQFRDTAAALGLPKV